MKRLLLFVVILTLSVGLSSTRAQSSFTFRLGGALPIDGFAKGELRQYEDEDGKYYRSSGISLFNSNSKSDGDGGFAGLGFSFGGQFRYGINNSGFGIIASADFIFNPMNSDIRIYKFDAIPKYLNFPLELGASYEGDINNSFKFYAEAAAGVNIRKITKLQVSAYSGGEIIHKYVHDYDIAKTFTYRLGVGVIYNEHLTLSLDFYALGATDVNGKETWNDYEDHFVEVLYLDDPDAFPFDRKLSQNSVLMLRIGYKIGGSDNHSRYGHHKSRSRSRRRR